MDIYKFESMVYNKVPSKEADPRRLLIFPAQHACFLRNINLMISGAMKTASCAFFFIYKIIENLLRPSFFRDIINSNGGPLSALPEKGIKRKRHFFVISETAVSRTDFALSAKFIKILLSCRKERRNGD